METSESVKSVGADQVRKSTLFAGFPEPASVEALHKVGEGEGVSVVNVVKARRLSPFWDCFSAPGELSGGPLKDLDRRALDTGAMFEVDAACDGPRLELGASASTDVMMRSEGRNNSTTQRLCT